MIFFVTVASILSLGLATPLENKFVPVENTNSRIINGDAADPGQFPWQVAVIYHTHPSDGVPKYGYCGGALISDQWILTTAHCVSDGVSSVKVELGMILLDDSDRIEAEVNETVIHPGYSYQTLANDIALLKLSKPVELSDLVKPIELSGANDTTGGDVNVTVSGWGKIYDESDGVSNSLNYVSLTTMTDEDCEIYYPHILKPGMLCCIGIHLGGTCAGDIGGPLITNNTDTGPVLVGVSSWIDVYGCETKYPSGYSRTSTYREWITETSGV